MLSPVTAGPDGAPAPGRIRLRGALARLALDAGRTVSRDALVDSLWGAEPPDAPTNALQALVARLRRALGAAVVERDPGGYRLAVDPHDVDALRFESLVAAARSLDPAQAGALLVEATALWRGPALADVRRLPFGDVAAARLDELRATAVELSAHAALLLGEPGAELDVLGALLATEPLRESAAALLARCLHAGGRQVEAWQCSTAPASGSPTSSASTPVRRWTPRGSRCCAGRPVRAVHPHRSRASWAARRTSAGSSACSRRTGW